MSRRTITLSTFATILAVAASVFVKKKRSKKNEDAHSSEQPA